MINKILNEIKQLLEGSSKMNSLDFSYYLEAYLIINGKKMSEEDTETTEILKEELPEICAMMEPGLDDTEFKTLLKGEFEKAWEAYYGEKPILSER